MPIGKKKYLFLICILISSGCNFVFGQEDNSRLANRASIDSLCQLGYTLAPGSTAESKRVSSLALNLSNKINYPMGRVNALNNFAIVNRNSGNFSTSLENLRSALKIAYDNNLTDGKAKCYYHLGDLHKVLGNFEKAKIYFSKAYRLFEKTNDGIFSNMSISNLAHTYMDQAIIHQDPKGYRTAISLYNEALKRAEDIHEIKRQIIAYINLSNAYNVYGSTTGNKNLFGQAILYAIKSYSLSVTHDFKSQQAISLNNIAEIKESLGETEASIAYYKKAFDLYKEIGESNWCILIHLQLGRIYQQAGENDLAEMNLLKGVDLARSQNIKQRLQEAYQQLSILSANNKNFEKAYTYSTLANRYKDSLLNERKEIVIKGMQIEFESDQKDQEITLLNKSKQVQDQQLRIQTIYRNGLIGGCLFLIVLIGLLWKRFRDKQRTEKEILHAKNEAEKARLMQEQFLANTSHEIRTPMNGIIGMTNQLQVTELSSKQFEYVNAINESANSLLVIINDLLDFSKIKAGKISFDENPFKLKDLFKNLSYNFEGRCKEKKLHWSALVDSQIPSVLLGDRVRLQQILLNLVSNAVKFTEKGEVSLVARFLSAEKGYVNIEFSVTDTGIGIPSDEISSIFESFKQLDAKTSRKQGGTGLGLSITKQLVEQMGGSIQVVSKEKAGTVFSFSLRMKRKVSVKKKVTTPIESKQLKFEKLSVLIVDDNKINRQVAQLTMQKWNVKSYLAESAKAAFEILSGPDRIDLILMDISMPEMDGFEATQYIRTKFSGKTKSIPVVAMTASAFMGDREKCLAAGMNDYISKPFKPIDLFEIIRRNLPEAAFITGQITDLDHLHDKADGDQKFLIDIMQTYVREMPAYVSELNEALKSEDPASIKAQAHKMKSPVALFGALDLKNDLQEIEIHVMENGTGEKLSMMIRMASDKCMKSVEEVRKELEKILLSPVN